jgi:hypothetical protein
MTQLVLDISPEELERIQMQAQRRGYDDLPAYIRALIDADTAAEDADEDEDDERSLEDIKAGIKEALREALRGEYVPLESLWTDDDDE